MKTFKNIIFQHSPKFRKLGANENDSNYEEDLNSLKIELQSLIKRNYKLILVFSILLVLSIILLVFLAIFFPVTGDKINGWAAIITITGAAPITLLGFIRNLWKDKINADILLKMVDSMNKDTFYSVLGVFVSMLKK